MGLFDWTPKEMKDAKISRSRLDAIRKSYERLFSGRSGDARARKNIRNLNGLFEPRSAQWTRALNKAGLDLTALRDVLGPLDKEVDPAVRAQRAAAFGAKLAQYAPQAVKATGMDDVPSAAEAMQALGHGGGTLTARVGCRVFVAR